MFQCQTGAEGKLLSSVILWTKIGEPVTKCISKYITIVLQIISLPPGTHQPLSSSIPKVAMVEKFNCNYFTLELVLYNMSKVLKWFIGPNCSKLG